MTTKAYILIGTAVGMSRDIASSLRSLPGIEAADRVTGPYDIIAVVQARDLDAIGRLIHDHVHTANGVARTATCVVMGNQ